MPVFLFLMIAMSTHAGVIGSGCSVQPSNAVVEVGKEISVNCQANGESAVNTWSLGSDGAKGTKVYQPAAYRSDGTVKAPAYIANGFSVIKINESQFTLQMKQISFAQGGLYYCDCINPPSTASAKVAVLAPEPEFFQNPDAVEGSAVNFTCSISFNGTADASFEISIKDSSGSILKRQSNLSLSMNQNRHHLTHSVTADPNAIQTFICSVKLIDSSSSANVLYSREKNATMQWKISVVPLSVCLSGNLNEICSQNKHGSYTGLVVTCTILALSLVLSFGLNVCFYRKIIPKQANDMNQDRIRLSSVPNYATDPREVMDEEIVEEDASLVAELPLFPITSSGGGFFSSTGNSWSHVLNRSAIETLNPESINYKYTTL